MNARARLQQARQAWRGLTARDRRLMLGLTVFLLAALAWLVLLQPAMARIAHWQQELPRLRSQANALQSLLAEAPGAVTVAGSELPAALGASLDSLGLQGHYQLSADPDAAGQWRLQLDDAPAAATLAWLLQELPRFPLTIRQAQLQRHGTDSRSATPGDGHLSGDVRLAQAPGAKEAP